MKWAIIARSCFVLAAAALGYYSTGEVDMGEVQREVAILVACVAAQPALAKLLPKKAEAAK